MFNPLVAVVVLVCWDPWRGWWFSRSAGAIMVRVQWIPTPGGDVSRSSFHKPTKTPVIENPAAYKK